MKLFAHKVFVFVFLIAFYGSGIRAQDIESNQLDEYIGDRSGAHYYYNDYEDYDNYYSSDQTEENVLDKPKFVSPQQFEDALATYKKYGMDYKQRKKVIEHEKRKFEEEGNKVTDLKASSDALLRLPVAVNWCEKVILPGFYLLSVSIKEGSHSVVFKQGNKTIVEIPVSDVGEQQKEVMKPFVVIEEGDHGNILVKLNTINSILKLQLPVYTDRKKFDPGI